MARSEIFSSLYFLRRSLKFIVRISNLKMGFENELEPGFEPKGLDK